MKHCKTICLKILEQTIQIHIFVIIDCTEFKIQKPSSLNPQSQCYSDYKSCTTLKGLVGVDPRGSIIFSSMLFTGSISDKDITISSGFIILLLICKKW